MIRSRDLGILAAVAVQAMDSALIVKHLISSEVLLMYDNDGRRGGATREMS